VPLARWTENSMRMGGECTGFKYGVMVFLFYLKKSQGLGLWLPCWRSTAGNDLPQPVSAKPAKTACKVTSKRASQRDLVITFISHQQSVRSTIPTLNVQLFIEYWSIQKASPSSRSEPRSGPTGLRLRSPLLQIAFLNSNHPP
jgi:hypothetical protein